MTQPNNGMYQSCACKWQDGNVVSFCGSHQMAADNMCTRRIKLQTDTLAEKYRKLTEGK